MKREGCKVAAMKEWAIAITGTTYYVGWMVLLILALRDHWADWTLWALLAAFFAPAALVSRRTSS
jgi:hypothetical protein